MVLRSNHASRSRRSSSIDRYRRNSIASQESSSYLAEENSNEMYSGAASEVIPSSITSLHYPHHFGRFSSRQNSSISAEASPLLAPTTDQQYYQLPQQLAAEGNDLYSVKSNSTRGSVDTNGHSTAGGFRFFSVDEIEMAPGGSTLENPEDPVDYNTNWDYSIGKYDEDEQDKVSIALDVGSHNNFQPGHSPQNQDDNSYGSFDSSSVRFDRRNNRRLSDESDKSLLERTSNTSSFGKQGRDETHSFSAISEYQRYYLAEEDLVIGIAGYKTKFWKQFCYYFICFATLGLGYLIFRWVPKYRVGLLGDRTPLGLSDWVVIENEFGELVIVNISKQRIEDRLSSFLVLTSEKEEVEGDGQGKYDDVVDASEHDPTITYMHSFTYRYIKFFYSPVEDMFRTNSNWYDNNWLSMKHTGDGVLQKLHSQRLAIFGENNIEIEEKSIFQLMMDEVLHPFYVFQVFSIFLWLADNYYYYATCIFIISVVSIANTLAETKSTINRLKEVSRFNCEVRVWRNNFWKQIDSNELVPGDVFEVDPSLNLLPCDALLINGECVINESMLTGESVPVTKVEATHETVALLPENFTSPFLARSFLYNGTKLLKMKSSNEEPVTAMVVKTGFNTTKGSLVRSMLFPKPTGFKFYEDSFKYIGFMTIIAAIGFIYSTYNFIQIGLDTKTMVLRALDIITIVVPPALPATLTIGTTFAINRLKGKNIFCIAPTRVNIGGKLDVMCFDKTGTLTEDGLDILGVHVSNNAQGRKEMVFEDMVSKVKDLEKGKTIDKYSTNNNTYLLSCMASCHSLRLIDDELLGDPLDAKMFEFANWNFEEDYVTSSGASYSRVYPNASTEGFVTVKEYEFISSLRRMSVLVREAASHKSQDTIVYTKGAPEVMFDICLPETLPALYEELLHRYTHNGYRVIACAYKNIGKVGREYPERESVESGMTFAGFIIFENKLKKSTKPTLRSLNEAKIRTVMCTGDNILTAISVARECELITAKTVYVPTYEEGANETNLVWSDVDNSENRLDSITLKPISLTNDHGPDSYRLAITGDVFRYLLTEVKNDSVMQRILMSCDIFARMSPDEKHELVEQLQNIDYTVGFCGDGANDCGALKAADVGISLSEAEASVAAPFTSRLFEISCVIDVIKEGRSSLVTSFSCFKYMSLYSAIQFITVSILYKTGTNLGDFQFLYIDMCLILPLAIFMSWSKPFGKLVIKRPTANLVSPKVLIPLCCHITIILIFQVFLWLIVHNQPWYIKPIPGTDDAVQSSDNTVLFLYTNFQYILIAIVLSTGPPYREPMTKNIPFLINVLFSCLLSGSIFLISQDSWWGDFMQLTDMPREWYWFIVICAGINLTIMLIGEKWWFPALARIYKRITKKGQLGSRKIFKNLRDSTVQGV